MHVPTEQLLTVYAVGAATTHTVLAAKRATRAVSNERKAILRNHVWLHKQSIKRCKQGECATL